jgi:hypothetical protein
MSCHLYAILLAGELVYHTKLKYQLTWVRGVSIACTPHHIIIPNLSPPALHLHTWQRGQQQVQVLGAAQLGLHTRDLLGAVWWGRGNVLHGLVWNGKLDDNMQYKLVAYEVITR